MQRDVWTLFHDGRLAELVGSVPGDVLIRLEIQYLRELFPEGGSHFDIRLASCTKLRFTPWDENPTEDLTEIQSLDIQVTGMESETPIVIHCAEGMLELEYGEMQVFLPSGAPVSYESLVAANEKYWNAFAERVKELERKRDAP